MTAWSNNFNGIASGTTVTTSNSGGVSGTAFSVVSLPASGTLTADTAAAFEGATGLQIVYPSTSQSGYVYWTISTAVGTRVSASFWYRVSALPPAGQTPRVLDLSTNILGLNPSGQFVVAPSTPLATSTAVAAGTWVFVQYAATANASTSGGRVECIITTAAGATLLSYDSGAAVSAGTGSFLSIIFGRSGAATAAQTVSYDLLNVSNSLTSGFPGSGAPTPTVISNTAVPTITGTARVASTLTASTGTWTPTPDSYTYQWKRAGVAISGATGTTYTVTSSDVGSTLTVTVTAVKSGYTSASATSAATAAVTDTGNVMVNIGGTWVAKPVMVNIGGTWVKKPVNYWNGTAWVTTPY